MQLSPDSKFQHARSSRRRFEIESLESRHLLAGIQITEFMARNDGALLDGDGESSDWIEIHNASADSVDLKGFYLSDSKANPKKWTFPSITLAADDFLVVFASSPKDEAGNALDGYVDPEGNIHASFKLAGDGEYLALTEPDGRTVATEFDPFPAQRENISYGTIVHNDGVRYFPNPTPGTANEAGVIGFLDSPEFSVNRGLYSESFELTITAPSGAPRDAVLVFTLDGSVPQPDSGLRIEPDVDSVATTSIGVSSTTIVRAALFQPDYLPSVTSTHSYLFFSDTIQQPRRIDGIPRNVDLEFDPDIANNPRFADELHDSLRLIPTMSIVMDHDDLFGARNGIYTHPLERGIEWERASSVELILPDGSTGFQEDAGVRIFGATTRNLPKKPFRISFRDDYGTKKLNYPLFPDSPAKTFDNIVLRAQQTNSWQRPGRTLDTEQADFLEDTWARDTAKAMGKLDGHSTFVHLYLNGLYWGVYNPVERPDSSFGEEYLGGQEEDYDAINRRPVEFNGEGTVAIDGDLTAWRALMELADSDLSDTENYDAIQSYISIDNVIQQFLLHQYMGHRDGPGNGHLYNNMRLIRKRAPDEPFYAFAWDMEYSFVDVEDNLNIDFPPTPDTMSVVYDALRGNPEFRMRYADLAHRYLFNNGALTPEQASQRYDQRAAVIESAIIGESARWGDLLPNHLRRGEPFNRDDEWAKERTRMLTEYFPQRAGILVDQLTKSGLYSSIDAPRFLVNGRYQHGGHVSSNAELSFSQEARSPFSLHELTGSKSVSNVYVPGEAEFVDDLSWTESSFDITSPASPWGASGGMSGTGGIGFDSGNGRYDELISTDIGAQIAEKQSTSVLIRKDFTIDQVFEHLQLDMKFDDGFVAYINGQEVVRRNASETSPPSSARATESRESIDTESFRIDLANVELNAGGTNVLAIQLLNRSVSNNDLLAVPVLYGATEGENVLRDDIYFTLDGTDPRELGGGIVGTRFELEVALSGATHVKARSYRDGQWSALTEASFIQSAGPGDFDADQIINAEDIDLLFTAIRSPESDDRYDLTADGNVDDEDRNYLVNFVLQTDFGDANLDGVFNSSDLVQVFREGKYESGGMIGEAGWASGDWDGDGLFGTRDLVLAFQFGSYKP